MKSIEAAVVKAAERQAQAELRMQKLEEVRGEAEQALQNSRWVQLLLGLRIQQAMKIFCAEDKNLDKAMQAIELDAEAHKERVNLQQQRILKLQAELEHREVELKNCRSPQRESQFA